MTERLTIKNFGPIKDVTIDLLKVNILIGENATGKSTIAKVLAVCRYFSYIKWDGSFQTPNPNESNFSLGLAAWGLSDHIKSNSFIYYECKHYSLTVENKAVNFSEYDTQSNSVIEILIPVFSETLNPKSKEFENLLSELEKLRPNPNSEYGYEDPFWTVPPGFFQNNVAAVMDNPFYLPAERGLQSIFSLGKSSIQNLSDALFNQLAKVDGVLRRFKDEIAIDSLDIFYKNVDGKGYVRKKEEIKYYSLFNSATGYQSTIPVVLTMKYYNEKRKKNKTFIIEEPELNLFPKAQSELVNYLVNGTVNFDNTILLTTHSPYILTSLNNLMYAFEVGKKEPEETNKIIDKKYWINPNDVSAYMLLPDGTSEDIVDREEGLIKAEKIDGVTNILNEQFSSMLNLQFSENEFDTH